MQYRRSDVAGATYFFTVNLAIRKNTLLVSEIDKLRAAINQVKKRHPFKLDAMVVLPDHMHVMWTLPIGDNDFSKRWMLIKSGFSRSIANDEEINISRKKKGERGIWQRRFWEHLIRDEVDYENHINYIHNNPVKHGYVDRVRDWPHSTFHDYVAREEVDVDWGCDGSVGEKAFGEMV